MDGEDTKKIEECGKWIKMEDGKRDARKGNKNKKRE